MRTQSPDHPDGIYHMHTCYKMAERVPHPEIGAVVARYLGAPDSDLPSFVRMGPTGNAGAGYLGPRYEPFSLGRDNKLPYFTQPYTTPEAERRRPVQRASRPGRRLYWRHGELRPVLDGLGIAVLSTSRGIELDHCKGSRQATGSQVHLTCDI